MIGDDRCDPQEARNAASKAIDQDQVKFIVGAVCSSASIPISEVANEKGVLQISPTSTNPQVTLDKDGKVKPYTFRACFIDPFQGTVAAKFALNTLRAKTAAVLQDVGNDYVKGLAEYFEAAFKAGGGGEVVVSESYTKDDTDFSAILSKVADANPDVLYHPDYYNKVSLIAKQARERVSPLRWSVAMAGTRRTSTWKRWTAATTPTTTRRTIRGLRCRIGSRSTGKYKAKPDALATLAYDAANILLTSMNEREQHGPAVVKDAMAKINFNGVSGKITYDEQSQPNQERRDSRGEGRKGHL